MSAAFDIPWLPEAPVGFPDPQSAQLEPNGLLAAGGALTPPWLLEAYASGIFPWFNDDSTPLVWWSPDPRGVLEPGAFKLTRSLRKRLRNGGFRVSADENFTGVISACAALRQHEGTWITSNMQAAYQELHEMGFAHSVEVWLDEDLVGGLYGVSLGTLFFGESMFAVANDASKIALYALADQLSRWDFDLIDTQLLTPHLASLGAYALPRTKFLELLAANPLADTRRGSWRAEFSAPTAMGSAP